MDEKDIQEIRSTMGIKIDEISSKLDVLGKKFFPEFSNMFEWLGIEGIPAHVSTSPLGITFTMYDTPNWMPLKLEKMEQREGEDQLAAMNETLAQKFVVSQEEKKACIRVLSKFILCKVQDMSKLGMSPTELIQVCISKGSNVGIKDEIIMEQGKKVQILMVTVRDFFSEDNLTREVLFKTLSGMILTKRLLISMAYSEE